MVLVTDWQEFLSLDYGSLTEAMQTPILIDGRNVLEPKVLVKAGFQYVGIGRPALEMPKIDSAQTAVAV